MGRNTIALPERAINILQDEGLLELLKKSYIYFKPEIIEDVWNGIRQHAFHEVGIQGEYTTGNVGDRAIGEAIVEMLRSQEYQTRIFGQDTTESNSKYKILGGGGVIHDWYGINPLRDRLKYIKDNGFVIGVGVPGIRSQEAIDLVSQALSNLELVTVRDQRSKRILEEVVDGEIICTADPAFVHETPEVPITNYTGINFRPWFGLDPFVSGLDNYETVMSYYFEYSRSLDYQYARKKYIDNIRSICNSVENPLFIPFQSKDERFAREYLDIEILPFENSVGETLKRVNSMRKMVTMRYHSLIFASICRKPILPINYEPKVDSLANRLDLPSYKPHVDIPVEFHHPNNVGEVEKDSRRNFELLQSYMD